MNQEVMALYKEHNVNPLGGCLPLLLQMPLLFAFYQLLASSIELRHAPYIGVDPETLRQRTPTMYCRLSWGSRC